VAQVLRVAFLEHLEGSQEALQADSQVEEAQAGEAASGEQISILSEFQANGRRVEASNISEVLI